MRNKPTEVKLIIEGMGECKGQLSEVDSYTMKLVVEHWFLGIKAIGYGTDAMTAIQDAVKELKRKRNLILHNTKTNLKDGRNTTKQAKIGRF